MQNSVSLLYAWLVSLNDIHTSEVESISLNFRFLGVPAGLPSLRLEYSLLNRLTLLYDVVLSILSLRSVLRDNSARSILFTRTFRSLCQQNIEYNYYFYALSFQNNHKTSPYCDLTVKIRDYANPTRKTY